MDAGANSSADQRTPGPKRRRRTRAWGLLAIAPAAVAVAAALGAGGDSDEALPDSSQRLLASDTAGMADPLPFWGALDCAERSRHRRIATGGDPAPAGDGSPQGDAAFRRLTAVDGDDLWGERCELGLNNAGGPVSFYREGERLVTYASFRLPHDFPLGAKNWQGVLQMKQAQPADNGGGTPVISLGAYQGQWLLFASDPGPTTVDRVIWRAPAEKEVWTRFRIEALYSQDPERGWIEVRVDLDGDGDSGGEDESSPRIALATLKRETAGDPGDGLEQGDAIPSHLRVGIYHDERIACPAPAGCSVDVDNVQVLRP